jgi:molecular chaperone GrpE
VEPRESESHEREIEVEADEDMQETGAKPKKAGRRHKPPKKQTEPGVEELSQELENVRSELEDTKDKLLRGLADFDNYRKRVAREREELVRCANEDLIRRLLEVIDNMERALEVAEASNDFEGFKQGIHLIYEHMKDVLTKEGLCRIECLGERFDPNYHEAVMVVDKEGEESHRVVEEIQKGYTMGGRLVRPSKVVVSK